MLACLIAVADLSVSNSILDCFQSSLVKCWTQKDLKIGLRFPLGRWSLMYHNVCVIYLNVPTK